MEITSQKIVLPGGDDVAAIVRRSIESFSITEQENGMPQGQLVLNDNSFALGLIFGYGRQLFAEWGIEKTSNIKNLFRDPQEITSRLSRGKIPFWVSGIKNKLAAGKNTLTLSLIGGRGDFAKKRQRNFTTGTLTQIITLLLSEEGAEPPVFKLTSDPVLTPANPIRQSNETNTATLFKLANRFNLVWSVQPSRLPGATFIPVISDEKIKDQTASLVRGQTGLYHLFEWGTDSGLISAEFSNNHNSPNGSAAQVTTDPGTGKKTLIFSAVEGQTFVRYRFRPDRIKKDLGLKEASRAIREITKAARTDPTAAIQGKYSRYFDRETGTTAPEQSGYSAKLDIVPNPGIGPGDRVFIGAGREGDPDTKAPPRFLSRPGNVRSLYRVARTKAQITGTSFNMNLECVR